MNLAKAVAFTYTHLDVNKRQIQGAHITSFAQFTAEVSMIRGCFSQLIKSFDENASKNTWALYLAEKVGKIQYSFPKITASGSAYQPSKMGFPEVFLEAVSYTHLDVYKRQAKGTWLAFTVHQITSNVCDSGRKLLPSSDHLEQETTQCLPLPRETFGGQRFGRSPTICRGIDVGRTA